MQSLRHLATLGSCGTLPASLCPGGHKRINIPPHFPRRPRHGHHHLCPPRRQHSRYLSSQALGDSSSNQNQPTFEAVNSLLKSLVRFNRKRASLHQLDRLRQLVVLLQKHPEASADAWRVGLVPTLEELQDCGQEDVERQARLTLSLLGHAPIVPGRGIRILSVDGGGTRGLVPIVTLRRLEELCRCPIHRMFDLVCGSSTGAIVTALLCLKKSPVGEVESLYRELSTEVFRMNNLKGIGHLVWNHAFYDAKLLESFIRREEGAEQPLFETAGEPLTPRTVFVSTVVNQPVIQPFLFRNYRHRTEDRNHAHYQGSSDVRVWEAIMASTAAPGYFGEVKLGSHVLQDGGLLTNNPCAIALREARLLWGRHAPIQCVVSLGTGIYRRRPASAVESLTNTSLKEKLTKVVASATDTEAVHTILEDLLPSCYFRFNPELTKDIPINESDPDKLAQLVDDANRFVDDNQEAMERAAAYLTAPKKPSQKIQEWVAMQWNKALSRTRHMTIR